MWGLLSAFMLPSSPKGTQPLRIVTLQPFGVYPWQAYVPPGDGMWPMPGVHIVADPPTTLSQEKPPTTQSALLQPFPQYGGAYSFRGA